MNVKAEYIGTRDGCHIVRVWDEDGTYRDVRYVSESSARLWMGD